MGCVGGEECEQAYGVLLKHLAEHFENTHCNGSGPEIHSADS